MTFIVDPAWALCVFLLSLRLGALFVLSPIWGVTGAPASFRVLFILGLSALLVSALPAGAFVAPDGLGALAAAAASELAIGALLAFGVFAAFAAFMLAGKVLDVQIGFGLGNVFDPVTRSQSPVLGTILNLLAVALFFAIDGHHTMLRGVAFSLEALPLGTLPATLPLDAVVKQFGTMFVLSLVLAAPVMFCLLIVEAALAVVSRNLPQMNVFIVAIPVKIFAGLAMLAASIEYLGPVAAKIFASIFRYWETLFAHG
jgi:flagellar biosynthesis protein FliR